MAFIRKKVRKGKYITNEAYWLVENHRINGKVRQKAIVYLGPCPTVNEAIAHWRKRAEKIRHHIGRLSAGIEATERNGPVPSPEDAPYVFKLNMYQPRPPLWWTQHQRHLRERATKGRELHAVESRIKKLTRYQEEHERGESA